MAYYVYGRDARTGEVIRRLRSGAGSEDAARAEATASGIEVTAVVLAPAQPAPLFAAPPVVTTASEESDAFERQLEKATRVAWVTYAAIAINLAVFVAMVVTAGQLVMAQATLLQWGADYGPRSLADQPWRMFTNMFVHISAMHVIANMIALGYVGRTVERMLGNASFLLLYIASGIAASLASLAWNPLLVSAGASGAVFGVYGALLGLLLRRRAEIPPQVFEQLKWFTIVFVVYNVILGLGERGTDQAAHLGGLACGFVLGLILGLPRDAQTPAWFARRALLTAAATAAVLLGVGIATRVMGGNVGAVAQAFDDIIALDRADTARLKEAKAAVKGGSAQPASVAGVETDLLPAWRAALAKLDDLAPYPVRLRARVGRVRDYMTEREAQWEKDIAAQRVASTAGTK